MLNNYGLSIQSEDPEAAAASFREVLALPGQHENADAYFNLGNALSDTAAHAEAVEAYGAAAKLAPDDGEFAAAHGGALLQAGAAAEAVAALRGVCGALRSAPPGGADWGARAHHSLGDALALERAWPEASAAYRDALAARPAHAPGWASLGNTLEEQGQYDEAEASWRKALEMAPDDDGTLLNLGGMLRRSERMGEARDAFERAVGASPENAEAYMALGKCYQAPKGGLAAADRGETLRHYVRYVASTYGVAIKLQPTNAGAYNAIGEGLRMYGVEGVCEELDGLGAHEMYEHALRLSPANTCAATHVAFGRPSSADGGGGGDEVCDAEAAVGTGGADGSTVLGALLPDEERAAASEAARGGLADGAGLADLSHEVGGGGLADGSEELRAALGTWRRHGVAVFPSLVDGDALATLAAAVEEAAAGDGTLDYTAVTRNSKHRVHKSLPVGAAEAALSQIASRLRPFLATALGADALSLMESGFMVTSPGAEGQQFHRDVAPALVSCSSLTASIQISLVDTDATQGALEVIPGSHAFDPSVSDRARADDPAVAKVPVAVPKGTVTVYALHTMHRGSSNTHTAKRPFFFTTLKGRGLAPPGLAYTIEADDIGAWSIVDGALARQ